ncbi:MAG: hypothetical protein A2600_12010 [Candidatus Lambdaproteobacteria bacterium RIFOXYD1_FULL_56_27]|nr:MAG: hypothetical protein A2426_08875 [Candidatus Lambdaproteobacteria bacterium RIFOXYC1_FULL_56_13]OGH07972.1 MAG: hypothetical protein A2600_12010 [Candidatus Lambdaproteobacteria bacterium RIFOXYD1_FULL_56_27]
MEPTQYPFNHLLAPIKLRGLTLPNRVMMSGLHLGLEEQPNREAVMAHFLRQRAAGEVGLVMVGGCSPNQEGRSRLNLGLSLAGETEVDKHLAYTEAVHQEGGRIALQICHFGREAFHGKNVSSSSLRAPGVLYRPRALEETEIRRTINDFAQSAALAVAAGYDSIEIVGSQGFLLHQFLSKTFNQRTDAWGGSLANRARFTLEVLEAVRAQLSPEFPLIFRFPALDLDEQGLTWTEVEWLVDQVVQKGVDLLNVGIGSHEAKVPTIAMSVPPAAFAPVVSAIRQRAQGIPVALSNRIADPYQAEQVLGQGAADMVSLGRPLLSDPEFVKKTRQNHVEQIRPCVACNQACLDHALTGKKVGCILNPRCLSLLEGQKPVLTKKSRRIAVVGAGLAGLASACWLAQRGHEVEVFEQSLSLGGDLHLAAQIPSKQDFGRLVHYFSQQGQRHGVRYRLGHQIDPISAACAAFDFYLLAQGGQPRRLQLPGFKGVIKDYRQVLSEQVPLPEPVVVLGGGGIALEMAAFIPSLNLRGNHNALAYLRQWSQWEAAPREAAPVTLLRRADKRLGRGVGPTTRWILLHKVSALGTSVVSFDHFEAEPDALLVTYKNHTERIKAASIIFAMGQTYSNGLAEGLRTDNRPHAILGHPDHLPEGVNVKSILSQSHHFSQNFESISSERTT